jgi:hypothetical protein
VVSTGQSRIRALARLLTACAVLFGLFLMHGSPASAATGCHAAMQEQHATAPVEHAAHGEHGAAAGMVPAASPTSVHMGAQAITGGHGVQCVATAARDRLPLPTIWLLVAVAFAGLAGWALVRWRLVAGGAGRRGPPGHGRDLLLRMCVARN